MKKIKAIVLIASVLGGYVFPMIASLARVASEGRAAGQVAKIAQQVSAAETTSRAEQVRQAAQVRALIKMQDTEATSDNSSEKLTHVRTGRSFSEKPTSTYPYNDSVGFKRETIFGTFKNWLGQKISSWMGWSKPAPEVSEVSSASTESSVLPEFSIPAVENIEIIPDSSSQAEPAQKPSRLITRKGSAKSASSPFAFGGQKREYSTFPMVPESKGADVPTFGWRSLVPGSTERKAKELVNSMDQLVEKMQQEGVSLKNIAEYKNLHSQYEKLVPGKDYNPIAGHSSLLKNAAEPILAYINADKEEGWFSQNDILNQLYSLGVRLNPEDMENLIKNTRWDERAKSIANLIDGVKNDEKLTIEKIGYVASLIVSSYQLFQSFGVDIFPYFGKRLNMDDMAWLSSQWKSIKNQSNRSVSTGVVANAQEMFASARLDNLPISYIKSNVTASVHQSKLVYPERSAFRDYPQGYQSRSMETNPVASLLSHLRETNYVDTFLNRAQKAGFFESASVGEETLALPSNSFDSAYNVLMQDGKYVSNEPAFRSFMLEYAPDILQSKVERGEITQEQFKYYSSKIAELNSARTAYQESIKK